jgi:hypothetical protein
MVEKCDKDDFGCLWGTQVGPTHVSSCAQIVHQAFPM